MQVNKRRVSPVEKANFFSKFFFWWSLKVLFRGFKKNITSIDDLYQPLQSHESKRLGDKLEALWDKEKLRKSPSLWRVLIKMFGCEFWKYAPIALFIECIKACHPVLVGVLIDYWTPQQNTVSTKEAYIYASLLVFTAILRVSFAHNFLFQMSHVGMKVKIAVSSLIYRKVMNMDIEILEQTSVGHITNLLTNDASRFENAFTAAHVIWYSILVLLIGLYYLYALLGLTSLVSVAVLCFFLILQCILASRTSFYRLRFAKVTDRRLKIINEIVYGIQIIKMYTWELPFEKLIETIRKIELAKLRSAVLINIIIMSFPIFINKIALLCTIAAYIFCGNHLNARYVYILFTYIDASRQGFVTYVPRAALAFAEAAIAIKRIESFLLKQKTCLKDHFASNLDEYISNVFTDISHNEEVSIVLTNASVIKEGTNSYILKNINFAAGNNQIIGIIGPVGAGKSSLLYTILQEMQLKEGNLQVSGVLSYASQEPWIFNGSIRENILFGCEIDEKRYKLITEVCCLERDLLLLPHGDLTIVGERGIMLSGGQKIRINLARAIYRDADIYLLDDPLSALDQQVGKDIFNKCFMGYLQNKCRILVTHQLQHLKLVDKIYVLKCGEISFSGTFEEAQNSQDDYLKFINADKAYTRNVQNAGEFRSSVVKKFENSSEQSRITNEESQQGSLSYYWYKRYFHSAGHWCLSLIVVFLFLLTQILSSGCDLFLAFWIRADTDKEITHNNNNNNTLEDFEISQYTLDYLYIYIALVLSLFVLTIIRSCIFVEFGIKSSKNLHERMLSSILHAKMKFFNSNPPGRIINRFSKDTAIVDENIPTALVDTGQILLASLGALILIAIMNYWVIVPSVTLIILSLLIRRIYSPTNSNLKRVEALSRSPIYSHLSTSLRGLSTIRASKSQQHMRIRFDNYQNDNSAAFYLSLACNTCFSFWIDIMCCIFILAVVVASFILSADMDSVKIGLAITQALSLCLNLQLCMKTWCEIDNQMTSVERIVEYSDLDQDVDDGRIQPPKTWPEDGRITFQSVSMRYSYDEPYVLKNLNFIINPGEKIGIVGRTGAGKSSLISAFFRLHPIEGKIIIDDLNIKDIALNTLRSKISIIPQDPVLFSGALRKNLDPFDEFDDYILWRALEDIEMKDTIMNLSSNIFTNISENGTNFSAGQRQLLCLARALIRRNKILLLDEVTANVDPLTDELIQNTIKEKFKDCTVLTIAHRLQTVMDYDKILVMDQGYIVQFDIPFLLLQEKHGVFYKLVYQAEPEVSEALHKIAEENYCKLSYDSS